MGRRSIFSSVSHLTLTSLTPVNTDIESDDIEKEMAPLAQNLPTEIEDEIIPQRN